MFRYDLNALSSEDFAKLCNALLLKTISDRIRPFDTSGKDAGRDADYEGKGQGHYSHLEGYWVFQYKHHDVSRLGVKEARAQVRSDVRDSLEKLFQPNRKKVDVFILITNVPFSGVITTGTHDWFAQISSGYPLIYAEVWDYTKLETLLDTNYELHKSFFPSLTYTQGFFKQIVERVSSSVFWEGLELLFQIQEEEKIVFSSRVAYEAAKDALWALYDNLSLVESGLSTITNYVYTWPEFIDLAGIAIQNPEYEISLGEKHWIKHAGLEYGGSRNIWELMRRLIGQVELHSNLAHRSILSIAESNRGITRIIANEANKYFKSSSFYTFYRDEESLVTPLQFLRYDTVEDVLKTLDKVVSIKERGHKGSLEGAQLSTRAFHNAILLTAGIRKGVQKALRILDGAVFLDSPSSERQVDSE